MQHRNIGVEVVVLISDIVAFPASFEASNISIKDTANSHGLRSCNQPSNWLVVDSL